MRMEWHGTALERQIEKAVRRSLDKLGFMMRNDTIRKMSAQQGPSKPGDYPATDSARLKTSLTHEVDGTMMKFGSPITSPPYPMFLELGTRKMSPRPWLRPALAMIKPQVIPTIKAEMRGILK